MSLLSSTYSQHQKLGRKGQESFQQLFDFIEKQSKRYLTFVPVKVEIKNRGQETREAATF